MLYKTIVCISLSLYIYIYTHTYYVLRGELRAASTSGTVVDLIATLYGIQLYMNNLYCWYTYIYIYIYIYMWYSTVRYSIIHLIISPRCTVVDVIATLYCTTKTLYYVIACYDVLRTASY